MYMGFYYRHYSKEIFVSDNGRETVDRFVLDLTNSDINFVKVNNGSTGVNIVMI